MSSTTIYIVYDVTTKLVFLFFVGMAIASLSELIRSWILLKPLTSDARKYLREFGRLLHVQAFAELRQQAGRFPKNELESGLREWSELQPNAGAQEFLTIFQKANASFRFATGRVEEILVSLRRWFALAILASLFLLVHDNQVVAKEDVAFHHLTPWAFEGAFIEISGVLLFGLGVSIAAFLIYWHISFRLARRMRLWNYLLSLAKLSSAPKVG